MITLKNNKLVVTSKTRKGLNEPFRKSDIDEVAAEMPKFKLEHQYENRAIRRLPENDNAGKILNNRKQTKARKGNRLLNKMAYFASKLSFLNRKN